MPPEPTNYAPLIFAVVSFFLFAFFIWALVRARKRRRAEFIEEGRKDLSDTTPVTEALERAAEAQPLEVVPDQVPELPQEVAQPSPEQPKPAAARVADKKLTLGLKRTQEGLLG